MHLKMQGPKAIRTFCIHNKLSHVALDIWTLSSGMLNGLELQSLSELL